MNYEVVITLLLVFVVYFLYQIAKQLSYITGVRIKSPFGQWDIKKRVVKKEKQSSGDREKLSN